MCADCRLRGESRRTDRAADSTAVLHPQLSARRLRRVLGERVLCWDQTVCSLDEASLNPASLLQVREGVLFPAHTCLLCILQSVRRRERGEGLVSEEDRRATVNSTAQGHA